MRRVPNSPRSWTMGLIRLFSRNAVVSKAGIDAGIFPGSTPLSTPEPTGGFGAPARAPILRHPPSWHRSRPSRPAFGVRAHFKHALDLLGRRFRRATGYREGRCQPVAGHLAHRVAQRRTPLSFMIYGPATGRPISACLRVGTFGSGACTEFPCSRNTKRQRTARRGSGRR